MFYAKRVEPRYSPWVRLFLYKYQKSRFYHHFRGDLLKRLFCFLSSLLLLGSQLVLCMSAAEPYFLDSPPFRYTAGDFLRNPTFDYVECDSEDRGSAGASPSGSSDLTRIGSVYDFSGIYTTFIPQTDVISEVSYLNAVLAFDQLFPHERLKNISSSTVVVGFNVYSPDISSSDLALFNPSPSGFIGPFTTNDPSVDPDQIGDLYYDMYLDSYLIDSFPSGDHSYFVVASYQVVSEPLFFASFSDVPSVQIPRYFFGLDFGTSVDIDNVEIDIAILGAYAGGQVDYAASAPSYDPVIDYSTLWPDHDPVPEITVPSDPGTVGIRTVLNSVYDSSVFLGYIVPIFGVVITFFTLRMILWK